MKIYGPYEKGNKRKYMMLIEGNSRTTINYSRYLIEQRLGKKLSANEDVHHINGNLTDDRIENLEIVNKSLHRRNHKLVYESIKSLICPNCNINFIIDRKNIAITVVHRKEGKAGPFCSNYCAAKYRTDVQYGRKLKIKPTLLEIKKV